MDAFIAEVTEDGSLEEATKKPKLRYVGMEVMGRDARAVLRPTSAPAPNSCHT